MEKIQITDEQEQELILLFTKMKKLWTVLFIIGVAGFFIPVGSALFGGTATTFYSSPTIAFLVLGIMFLGKSEIAIKKIMKKEYQVFKTICRKKKMLEHALVDNNEILSKKVKRPLKWILILGSHKSIQVNDDIGIFQADKDFWAFSLNK